MSKSEVKSSKYREKWRDTKGQVCHCCGEKTLFCWRCRNCGCKICQNCMHELKWGVCGPIMWVCPDCGELNGLGNQ